MLPKLAKLHDASPHSPASSPNPTCPPATPAGLPHRPMTIHELRQEIRDRRALARHAKRRGLKIARAWHVQLALNARAELRAYATR